MKSIFLTLEQINKLKLLLHDIELLQKQNELFDNEAIEILSFNVIEHLNKKENDSKQEISDEEIEKAADIYRENGSDDLESYAKLINHISDISKMVEDDVEKLALEWFVTADKRGIYFDLGWCKIFTAGYNKAKETLYTRLEMIKCWNASARFHTSNSDVLPDFKEFIDFIDSFKQSKKY